jgi:hypothetical protein
MLQEKLVTSSYQWRPDPSIDLGEPNVIWNVPHQSVYYKSGPIHKNNQRSLQEYSIKNALNPKMYSFLVGVVFCLFCL